MPSWHRRFPRRKITLALTSILFVSALIFSAWLVGTFLAVIRFRDNLINREYEGSLSTNLGFLVALTAEASQHDNLSDERERQREKLGRELLTIRDHLSSLTALPEETTPRSEPVDLEARTDEVALRRLLADPRLAETPLGELGLRLEMKDDLREYPFLRSIPRVGGEKSFVFVPAASVDAESAPPGLSLRRRRELVFSTIAARRLEALLERVDKPRITLAYYIGCSDFIHLVSPQPLRGPGFSPLQSFVDRTYFAETRVVSGVRESELYLDLTGGGFVRTYSVFIDNRTLGLCGMVAIDSRLQTLDGFWQDVGLGTRRGALRDFAFAKYSLTSHEIEPQDALRPELWTQVAATLASWEGEKLRGGILRFAVESTTIFTVPIEGGSIGLFVFDAQAMRNKYYFILTVGFVLFVGFVWMVGLTAREQRAAAAAERLQGEVLENLHGGVVMVDRHGAILGSTRRFRQMVGDTRAEGTIDRFLAPASAAEYRRLATGGSFEFAGSVQTNDQGSEPVIIASAPLSLPGGPDHRMLILIPSAELEQTIAKKFLNFFSHALKSPVHSILLIADLFRRRNALRRFDEYYAMLYRKVQEFQILTDNVLRFSAHEVKAIQVESAPMNVAQVLRQVLSDARQRAALKGLTLRDHVPGNLQLVADAGLLQIVMNNLVDNALKHTAEGHVTVRAVDLLTRVEIAVEDSGPGVPEDERERIFELFVQGSRARPEGQEGLGLGLYISRLYVEAMGGTMRYEPVLKGESGAGGTWEVVGSRFVAEFYRSSGRVAGD